MIVDSSAVKNTSTCEDNTVIMIALCLGSIAMFVPIGVLASKMKNLKIEDEEFEMSKFDEAAPTNRALKENAEESARDHKKRVSKI